MGVYLIVVGIFVAAFDIALSTLLSIYLHTDYSNNEVKFLPDCLPGHNEILFFIALLLLLTILTAVLFILTPKNGKLKMLTPYLIVLLLKLVFTIACAVALFYPKEKDPPNNAIMKYFIPGPKNCTTTKKQNA